VRARRAGRSGPPLELEISGGVAVLTLARPAAGNVLDDALMHALAAAADTLADRDELCAVVLRARGPAFSRGLPPAVAWPPRSWPDGVAAIARLPMPVVAAIRGEAAGWGLALALACDLRVAATGARFSLPETGAGRLPGGGVTPRLARLVGPARAADLVLLGTVLSGRDATAWGLATRAVPPTAVDRTALAMARALARRGPTALRYAKEAVVRALDLPLDDGIRLEHDLYVLLQTTADRREGVQAFLQRRPPRFQAR
jgi:enoyl-CoA hydratase/carnithine racemase